MQDYNRSQQNATLPSRTIKKLVYRHIRWDSNVSEKSGELAYFNKISIEARGIKARKEEASLS